MTNIFDDGGAKRRSAQTPPGQVRRGQGERPAGAEASPRMGERAPIEGLGPASAGVSPLSEPLAPQEAPADPKPTKPASAMGVGALALILLVIGFVLFPFFVFALPVALVVALGVLVVAGVLAAARRRPPYPRSSR